MTTRATAGATPADKICASCGRPFAWRKKWARSWDDVRYCSDACRRRKVDATDQALEEQLRASLHRTGRADPEQVAAAAEDNADPAERRETARRAARRLVAAGEAEALQRGRAVDAGTVRGAFTLRRRG